MVWNTPTNKDEMYEILKDIFVYYRLHKTIEEAPTLNDLVLPRIEFNPLSNEQLLVKAEEWAAAEIKKKILDRAQFLQNEMNDVEEQVEAVFGNYYSKLSDITRTYGDSQAKVENKAITNGLVDSGVLVDKLTSLEKAKNEEISFITYIKDSAITTKKKKKGHLITERDALDSIYRELKELITKDKFNELVKEQEATIREVFKYNNSIEEKEQRFRNSKLQAEASLDLKYKELRALELSKDELIELGYYADIISCVQAYYDTLDPVQAYHDLMTDSKAMLYLEDYYSQLLSAYRLRMQDYNQ